MFVGQRWPLLVHAEDDGAGGGGSDDSKAGDGDAAKAAKTANDAAFADMRRKAADAEKRAEAAEKKLKDADEAKAKADGDWKKLAEDAAKERDDARAEADEAKKAAAKVAHDTLIEKVAARLEFANATQARRLADVPDDADEKAIEGVLKALAKDSPYLLNQQSKRTGREVGTHLDKDGKADPQASIGSFLLAAIDEKRGAGAG